VCGVEDILVLLLLLLGGADEITVAAIKLCLRSSLHCSHIWAIWVKIYQILFIFRCKLTKIFDIFSIFWGVNLNNNNSEGTLILLLNLLLNIILKILLIQLYQTFIFHMTISLKIFFLNVVTVLLY
jgi:hypothetical protein